MVALQELVKEERASYSTEIRGVAKDGHDVWTSRVWPA
jgi:hypothetical protein